MKNKTLSEIVRSFVAPALIVTTSLIPSYSQGFNSDLDKLYQAEAVYSQPTSIEYNVEENIDLESEKLDSSNSVYGHSPSRGFVKFPSFGNDSYNDSFTHESDVDSYQTNHSRESNEQHNNYSHESNKSTHHSKSRTKGFGGGFTAFWTYYLLSRRRKNREKNRYKN